MKKFAALVLTLILTLTTLSSAFAATNVGANTTSENPLTFEMVPMAIASNGKIAAKMSSKENNSDLKVYNGDAIEKIESVTKNGGILRAKGMIPGGVDENYYLSDGSTFVELALEIVNSEELAKALIGKTLNAVNVVDGTAIYDGSHIGHRVVGQPTNLVAKLHQKNGNSINVYYCKWDGEMALVLDADAIYSSNTGDKGDTPVTDNNNESTNEPDPMLRDRNPVASNTTSSSSTSSTTSSSSSSAEPNPGLRGR